MYLNSFIHNKLYSGIVILTGENPENKDNPVS